MAWGAFTSAPSGLRLCINYVELPVRRSFKRFCRVVIWNLFIPLRTCKVSAAGNKRRQTFVLALLRGPTLNPPKLTSKMCMYSRYLSTKGSLFGHDVSTPHLVPTQVPLDRDPLNMSHKGMKGKKGNLLHACTRLHLGAPGAISYNPNRAGAAD